MEISRFPSLEESGFPSVVNNTSLSPRIRDKSRKNDVPMKKATVPSVLVLVLLMALAIKAEAQQLPKVPRIGNLEPATPASISGRIEASARSA